MDNRARLGEREGLTKEQVGRGSYYLTRNTLHSLAELFTGAKTIMQWLNDCAKLISTLNMPVTWVTPLGLAVMQPYRKNGQMNVRTLVQQVTLTTDNDELPVSRTRQVPTVWVSVCGCVAGWGRARWMPKMNPCSRHTTR